MGAAQVGLLAALLAKGIRPDLLVGCSVGALNAVFIASEPSVAGADRLRHIWLRMRRDDLFPGGRLATAWHAMRRGSHVFANEGLRRIIRTELGVEVFEDLKLPSPIVAATLNGGRETWFSSGRIEEALLASTAMPGVFPPVTIDGIDYVDGGVANNIPISKAVQLGAKVIYVINTSGIAARRTLERPHDFMLHGFVLARGVRYNADLEAARRRAEVVVMPPVEVGHVSFTDLSRTPALIEAGLETGLEFLQAREQPDEVAKKSRLGI